MTGENVNETTPCFEAKNFLESDFPEIFLAGLGCVLLNVFYFLGWSLGDLWQLAKVLWIYRPYSTTNDEIIGTRIGFSTKNRPKSTRNRNKSTEYRPMLIKK